MYQYIERGPLSIRWVAIMLWLIAVGPLLMIVLLNHYSDLVFYTKISDLNGDYSEQVENY